LKIVSSEYKHFIQEIKSKIRSSQIKASLKVNEELLRLYWDLAQMIVAKQAASSWGSNFIETLSKELKREFPSMKGFSTRNLKYMRQWFLFWVDDIEKGQQLVAQSETGLFHIPWGHNIVILTKCETKEEALFYVRKTIENNYSRVVLIHQIESNLYARDGKSINNFSTKLFSYQSDLAKEILKDPYSFDFLTLSERYNEKELEDALTHQMTDFLLELGSGFAFVGKQYQLKVEGDDFFIDLLFYHIKLQCYVVVELKTTKFKPEFAGQLNFYVSAVDGELKSSNDNPTIGILICKSKNDTVVEYALQNIATPIGVSEYELVHALPSEFKSSLPSIEEIEEELRGVEV